MNLIECNIWCIKTENPELEDLGIAAQETDVWMPACINLDHVAMIKMNADTDLDFVGANKAVFYIDGQHLVTDLDYYVAVQIWKNI